MVTLKLDRITILLMALFMGILMSTDAFMLPVFSKTLVFLLGFASVMAAAPMSAALAESLAGLTRDEFDIREPGEAAPDGSVYVMAASIGCILFAGFVSVAQNAMVPVF